MQMEALIKGGGTDKPAKTSMKMSSNGRGARPKSPGRARSRA
jgi:hypothetical protein